MKDLACCTTVNHPYMQLAPFPGIGLVGLGAPGRGSTADASGDEFDF